MIPYYDADGITIYHGDCRDTMRAMESNSVHAIVTDPPYGDGFAAQPCLYQRAI